MAGIGILAEDNGSTGYAYKVLVPTGALQDGVIDLSIGMGTDDIGLRDNYNYNYQSAYKEFTYDGQQLQEIIVWVDSSKTQMLYSKVFTYSGSTLVSIVSTDVLTGKTLTKLFSYTNGLTSIQEIIA